MGPGFVDRRAKECAKHALRKGTQFRRNRTQEQILVENNARARGVASLLKLPFADLPILVAGLIFVKASPDGM